MRARLGTSFLLLSWLASGCPASTTGENSDLADGRELGGGDLAMPLALDQGASPDLSSSGSGGGPWTRQLTGSGTKILYSLAVDGGGNVVATGKFQGTANFGKSTLTSAGGSDVFVARYAADGSPLWAQQFGGVADDNAYGVAVDKSGNVVIAGYFQGTVDFGGGPLVSAGFEDIFVAAYSASGTHLWSRSFGGSTSDEARGVAVDTDGNVLFTGSFGGAVNFGGGLRTSAGVDDIFLAKYTATGVHLWSKQLGGTDADTGHTVAVDGGGNVLLGGEFYKTVDFGGGPLNSRGVGDLFVAKYTSDGTYVWARRAGDVASDVAHSVAADSAGNVLVTGSFNGTMDLGGGPLTSAGGNDIFLASYSPAGVLRWSKGLGSTSTDDGYRVATDSAGNVLVAGSFNGKVNFGGGVQTAAALLNAFVARYSPSGGFLSAKHFGGSGSTDINSAFGIAADSSGNLIAGGYFTGTVDFGDGPRTASGTTDIFLIKR